MGGWEEGEGTVMRYEVYAKLSFDSRVESTCTEKGVGGEEQAKVEVFCDRL